LEVPGKAGSRLICTISFPLDESPLRVLLCLPLLPIVLRCRMKSGVAVLGLETMMSANVMTDLVEEDPHDRLLLLDPQPVPSLDCSNDLHGSRSGSA
jgi:hypothetical protein